MKNDHSAKINFKMASPSFMEQVPLSICHGWQKISIDPKGSRQNIMHSCKSAVACSTLGICSVQTVCLYQEVYTVVGERRLWRGSGAEVDSGHCTLYCWERSGTYKQALLTAQSGGHGRSAHGLQFSEEVVHQRTFNALLCVMGEWCRH